MNRLLFFLSALMLPLAVGLLSPACGGDAEEAQLALEGDAELFPGFEYSTGLQPDGAPVQASFTVTAGGTGAVRALAVASGSESSPTLTGLPETGSVDLEGAFGLEGQLKVDISGLPSYDGPIPGIENVSIAFEGAEAFDPFAIGSPVTARADIPASRLPGIPLPGGIPGQLVLEVAEGSFMELTFLGDCAGVDGDEATYAGAIERGGSLVIKPIIEIEVPVTGTKTFEIPSFTVDLALGASDLDMAAEIEAFGDEPDQGDQVDSACEASSGTGGGGVGGSASSSGGAGATTTGTTTTGTTVTTTGSGGAGTGGSGGDTESDCNDGIDNDLDGAIDCADTDCNCTATATVEVAGNPMTVTGIDMWPPGAVGPEAHVFIDFTGSGFGSGSDVHLVLTTSGSGCHMDNDVWLRPEIGNPTYPNQFHYDGTSTCGFTVTSMPSQPGQYAAGTFSGWLDELNGSDEVYATVTFEVPWQ